MTKSKHLQHYLSMTFGYFLKKPIKPEGSNENKDVGSLTLPERNVHFRCAKLHFLQHKVWYEVSKSKQ